MHMTNYTTTHVLVCLLVLSSLSLFGGTLNTACTASVKTASSPCLVKDEHSIYLTALIRFANARASAQWTLWPWSVVLSLMTSHFVPTRIKGTLGQWWTISGYHCIMKIIMLYHDKNDTKRLHVYTVYKYNSYFSFKGDDTLERRFRSAHSHNSIFNCHAVNYH